MDAPTCVVLIIGIFEGYEKLPRNSGKSRNKTCKQVRQINEKEIGFCVLGFK